MNFSDETQDKVRATIRRMAKVRHARGMPDCDYVVFGRFEFPDAYAILENQTVLFRYEKQAPHGELYIVSKEEYDLMKRKQKQSYLSKWAERILEMVR